MTDEDEAVLCELLLELLARPCRTGEEGPLADWLTERYIDRGETVERIGHSVIAGAPAADDERPTVLLVGHLDVVPPTDADLEPRIEDGRIVGRGASDMKSGLAVAMSCFESPELRAGPYALRLIAYAGEEGAHEENELGDVLRAVGDLCDADLAVVLEPTDLEVQLGCLGVLNTLVTVRGHAAHAARPWHGDNALTKAGTLLSALHADAPQDVEVDGLVYREVVTATQGWTSNARNVVPDAFTMNLSYRFSPLRSVADAEQAIEVLVGAHGDVDVVDRAPAALPRRQEPLVEAFTAAVGASVAPKQAWTDVARFAEVGVPALNYGPGLTAQAHQRGEHVPIANLRDAHEGVERFLRG